MARVYVVLALVGALFMPVDAAAKAPVHHHARKAAKRCVVRRHHRRCVARKPASKRAAAKPKPAVRKPAPVSPTAPGTPAPVALPPVGPSSPPVPVVPTQPAARLQATAQDLSTPWSITLSHASITAGPAIIELRNLGQDAHNLHIRPAAGGADVFAFPTVESGRFDDEHLTLAAGSYTLYCSLPSHEDLGMKATLVVQ